MSIEPFSIEDFTTDLPDDEFIPYPSEYNIQESDMKNYIGEVVEIIPPTDITLESIADYISQCSSVVRDKEPANAMKLLTRLMTESYGDKASRVLEYIPCTINLEDISDVHQIFGFFQGDSTYYTNARELLNWGWTFDEVLAVVDFTNYRTFHCVAPYFIYGQLSTHTQITSVSHSQRYGSCDRGYWQPEECKNYFFSEWAMDDSVLDTHWNKLVENYSPSQLKSLMKLDCGIKRKEVWDRGADMLQNRVFTLGGYIQPNGWTHFIAQRLDSHTQLETRDFTQLIANIIKEE